MKRILSEPPTALLVAVILIGIAAALISYSNAIANIPLYR